MINLKLLFRFPGLRRANFSSIADEEFSKATNARKRIPPILEKLRTLSDNVVETKKLQLPEAHLVLSPKFHEKIKADPDNLENFILDSVGMNPNKIASVHLERRSGKAVLTFLSQYDYMPFLKSCFQNSDILSVQKPSLDHYTIVHRLRLWTPQNLLVLIREELDKLEKRLLELEWKFFRFNLRVYNLDQKKFENDLSKKHRDLNFSQNTARRLLFDYLGLPYEVLDDISRCQFHPSQKPYLKIEFIKTETKEKAWRAFGLNTEENPWGSTSISAMCDHKMAMKDWKQEFRELKLREEMDVKDSEKKQQFVRAETRLKFFKKRHNVLEKLARIKSSRVNGWRDLFSSDENDILLNELKPGTMLNLNTATTILGRIVNLPVTLSQRDKLIASASVAHSDVLFIRFVRQMDRMDAESNMRRNLPRSVRFKSYWTADTQLRINDLAWICHLLEKERKQHSVEYRNGHPFISVDGADYVDYEDLIAKNAERYEEEVSRWETVIRQISQQLKKEKRRFKIIRRDFCPFISVDDGEYVELKEFIKYYK